MKRTLSSRFTRLNTGLFVSTLVMTGLIVHVRAQGQPQCVNLGSGDNYFDGSNETAAVCIEGGDGEDTLIGSDFADTLDSQADQDTVYGGDDRDEISDGGGVRDRQYGEDDEDTIHAGNGLDEDVYGGADDDVAYGGNGQDGLQGRGGDDFLEAGQADDGAGGDGDNDTVYAGNGADTIVGDEDTPAAGSDVLYDGVRPVSGPYAADSSEDTFYAAGDGAQDAIHAGEGDIVCADDCDSITVYSPGTTIVCFTGLVKDALAGNYVSPTTGCAPDTVCP